MENEELIVCTRCHVPKKKEAFWWDKRRNQVRKPCRDCRNKKENLKVRLRNANNVILREEVVKYYDGKNLTPEMVNFYSDLIVLNRTIKKMQKPIIKSDGLRLHLFCPNCGAFESVELPCGAELFSQILNFFTEEHKNCHEY